MTAAGIIDYFKKNKVLARLLKLQIVLVGAALSTVYLLRQLRLRAVIQSFYFNLR